MRVGRLFPVFQQKAGTYGAYSEYMTRHGCACCSLTTIWRHMCRNTRSLRPDETIARVEREVLGEEAWRRNYSRHIARQMPVSLYGISRILTAHHIPHRYVGSFSRRAGAAGDFFPICTAAGRWWWDQTA